MKSNSPVIDHPTLEPAYRAALGLRLLRELTKGPLDFVQLVKAAEGAYPADVMASLCWLRTHDKASLCPSGLWTSSPRSDSSRPGEVPHKATGPAEPSDGLPEPHPLDFDWRFTRATLGELKLRLGASQTDRVAILGAPTLYRCLVDSGVDAWLLDKNPHVTEDLRGKGYGSVVECDLLELPDLSTGFDLAAADPPWYVEHYEAFLDAGRKLLVPGGKLLLSVLPRLTRPSAPADRFRVLECALNLGFDLVEASAGALHYASPPFEIEALRAEGIVIDDWRTGDLFSFVLRSSALRSSNSNSAKENKGRRGVQWQTLQLGKTTIKIGVEPRSGLAPFDYQPVSPTGDPRLHSVSRRSPVRPKINVWTSRNIALTVRKPAVLADAIEDIVKGESLASAVAGVVYKYQLNVTEAGKLRQVLQLLMRDAGLAWTD